MFFCFIGEKFWLDHNYNSLERYHVVLKRHLINLEEYDMYILCTIGYTHSLATNMVYA